jgi:2-dehydro-3-deoxygalactonokinase
MAASFLAVDWGTSNRRAYLVGASGSVAEEMEDAMGILAVSDFDAEIAGLRRRFGDVPMLLGGMVGSNRGWRDAGYVACPANLDALAAGLHWVEPGRTAIIPGLSLTEPHYDVMRGEETQILGGVAAGLLPADALVCHPGTHNKWIELEDGSVTRFRTVMTGELFRLLEEHSILSDMMRGTANPGPAFDAGVEHGLTHDDLPSALFGVRARTLLGAADAADAASFVSGLLIGNDLRIGLGRQRHDVVHVVGRPELTELYAAALEQSGRVAVRIDGEGAFVAGARAILARAA